jgi:DNA-binding protein H-NS
VSTNQYQLARQKAKEEEPKKALENLFHQPPKSKGIPMANKLDDLQKQIETLQKERDALLSKEKSSAIEDINEKIKLFGIRVRDLNFGEPVKITAAGRAKVAMKYQSGTNFWSGRGRKPKWVEAHLAKGGKLEEILIK